MEHQVKGIALDWPDDENVMRMALVDGENETHEFAIPHNLAHGLADSIMDELEPE